MYKNKVLVTYFTDDQPVCSNMIVGLDFKWDPCWGREKHYTDYGI